MSKCEQEMCQNWTGEGCACEVLGLEPNVVKVPAIDNEEPLDTAIREWNEHDESFKGLPSDGQAEPKHDCGLNSGDCNNRCGQLPVTPENLEGYLEYLDFDDGFPSGGKMYAALLVAVKAHEAVESEYYPHVRHKELHGTVRLVCKNCLRGTDNDDDDYNYDFPCPRLVEICDVLERLRNE